MKKFIAILLSVITVLSLFAFTGCKKNSGKTVFQHAKELAQNVQYIDYHNDAKQSETDGNTVHKVKALAKQSLSDVADSQDEQMLAMQIDDIKFTMKMTLDLVKILDKWVVCYPDVNASNLSFEKKGKTFLRLSYDSIEDRAIFEHIRAESDRGGRMETFYMKTVSTYDVYGKMYVTVNMATIVRDEDGSIANVSRKNYIYYEDKYFYQISDTNRYDGYIDISDFVIICYDLTQGEFVRTMLSCRSMTDPNETNKTYQLSLLKHIGANAAEYSFGTDDRQPGSYTNSLTFSDYSNLLWVSEVKYPDVHAASVGCRLDALNISLNDLGFDDNYRRYAKITTPSGSYTVNLDEVTNIAIDHKSVSTSLDVGVDYTCAIAALNNAVAGYGASFTVSESTQTNLNNVLNSIDDIKKEAYLLDYSYTDLEKAGKEISPSYLPEKLREKYGKNVLNEENIKGLYSDLSKQTIVSVDVDHQPQDNSGIYNVASATAEGNAVVSQNNQIDLSGVTLTVGKAEFINGNSQHTALVILKDKAQYKVLDSVPATIDGDIIKAEGFKTYNLSEGVDEGEWALTLILIDADGKRVSEYAYPVTDSEKSQVSFADADEGFTHVISIESLGGLILVSHKKFLN